MRRAEEKAFVAEENAIGTWRRDDYTNFQKVKEKERQRERKILWRRKSDAREKGGECRGKGDDRAAWRGERDGREKNEGKNMEQWAEWNFKRLAYINLSHNDPRRDAPGIISVERGHHAACRPLGRENAARKKQHSPDINCRR